jgi:hypothetical protein
MGQGNRSVQHEYLYTDHNVLAGQSYWYYLVDVDLSGQRTYHGPLSVLVRNNRGLNGLSSNIPKDLRLYPNFPNPFNSRTIIHYALPARPKGGPTANYVDLGIYNSLGEMVAVLVSDKQAAGVYQVEWDGKSDKRKDVSSGVYFVVLKIPDRWVTVKIILMR